MPAASQPEPTQSFPRAEQNSSEEGTASFESDVTQPAERESVLRALGLPETPRVHLPEPDWAPISPVVLRKCDEMGDSPQLASSARLQLLGELGRGGMGAIVKGRDMELGRDVAVKVLLKAHQGKPEMVERFVDEAQIHGQLQHPGVAPVYELGRLKDDRPYFSMKLVKGQTLSQLLAEREKGEPGAPSLARLLSIFEQICQTLAYAHARNLIHRDLKPSNVMVGAYSELQVMDWGLAKVLAAGGSANEKQRQAPARPAMSVIRTLRSEASGQGSTCSPRTQAGSVLGTPAYMAPEQARGDVDLVDQRSDVFGLGAIFCEILTGEPPYTGSGAEVLRKSQTAQLDDAYARLSVCEADAELISLAKCCLAAEPWDRPADAGEVAGTLMRHEQSVAHRLRQAELECASAEARGVEEARTRRMAEAKAEEERKRRRVTLALAATMTVAAFSLGTVTAFLTAANDRERQARVAEQRATARERQAREGAEANLRLARKAVDRGFTRVSELPELKGQALEVLRRDLLREAQEFYEQFVHQQPDEPGIQADQGRAYLRLAYITEDLGNRSKAVEHARQAEGVFRALSKDDAGEAKYQDGMARSLTTMGRNYRELGQFQQAQEALEHSLELRQKLVAAHPGARDYRIELALTFNQLGLLYMLGLRKLPEGVAALENAKALCEQLHEELPREPEYLSELAQTFNNLMLQSDFNSRYEQAVAHGERAAALLEQLVGDYPQVAEYQHRLTYGLVNIASNNIGNGHPERALAPCVKALPVAEQLARAHPDIPAYKNRVAHIHVIHAGALAGLGEFREAAAETAAAEADASLGATIYNIACTYCLCATSARKSATLSLAERDKLVGQYLDQAMATLRQARAKTTFFMGAHGVRLLKSDRDLEPLRSRDDFRRFLSQIEE